MEGSLVKICKMSLPIVAHSGDKFNFALLVRVKAKCLHQTVIPPALFRRAVLRKKQFYRYFSVFILDVHLKFLLGVNRAILTMALLFLLHDQKENKMFLLYFILQDLFKILKEREKHTAEIWHSNF